MRINAEDKRCIQEYLRGIADTEEALRMKGFRQHGHVTTYQHVMNVVCMSCAINRAVHMHANCKSLVRGAFLHDYYLYDWHAPKSPKKLHGFRHPMLALENANKSYELTPKEQNIIVSHMWPLTLTRVPKSREAAIVCLSDKLCAVYESVFRDKTMYDIKL